MSYLCSDIARINKNVVSMNKVKQLPYGISDFEYVMRENYYYVAQSKHSYIRMREV